jgi:hypothetical protein
MSAVVIGYARVSTEDQNLDLLDAEKRRHAVTLYNNKQHSIAEICRLMTTPPRCPGSTPMAAPSESSPAFKDSFGAKPSMVIPFAFSRNAVSAACRESGVCRHLPNATETAMAGKSLGLLTACPSGVPPLSAYAYQRSVSLLLAGSVRGARGNSRPYRDHGVPSYGFFRFGFCKCRQDAKVIVQRSINV